MAVAWQVFAPVAFGPLPQLEEGPLKDLLIRVLQQAETKGFGAGFHPMTVVQQPKRLHPEARNLDDENASEQREAERKAARERQEAEAAAGLFNGHIFQSQKLIMSSRGRLNYDILIRRRDDPPTPRSDEEDDGSADGPVDEVFVARLHEEDQRHRHILGMRMRNTLAVMFKTAAPQACAQRRVASSLWCLFVVPLACLCACAPGA